MDRPRATTGSIARAAAWMLLALVIVLPAAAATRAEVGCAGDIGPVRLDVPADGLDIAIGDGGQWLEVEESGQALRFADSVPGQIDLSQPLRYGWRWRPVHAGDSVAIRRVEPGQARGRIRATLHCALSTSLIAQLDWLHNASAIAGDAAHTVAPSQYDVLLAKAQGLIDSAVDTRARVFAMHLYAMIPAVNDHPIESAKAFGKARIAWQALGDDDRALAASVGQTGMLYLAGRYGEVLALTQPSAQIDDSQMSYFLVRRESTRCLAQKTLGQMTAAEACYRWVLAKLLLLGELGEYAVALQNYASLLRDQGDLQGAMRLGEQALQAVTGSDAAMVRGRIHVMLADLALRTGDVNRSLIESDAALDAFDAARQGVRRWQANVYLHMARLYTQLGAYSEACDALAAAVAHLAHGDAPSRFALAMEDFANIEEQNDNLRSALFWQRAAEAVYGGLAMPEALDAARASRVALQIESGDVGGAERAVAEHGEGFAANRSQWMLLAAELAIRRGDAVVAQQALNELDRLPLSLKRQVRAASLRARHEEMIGNSQQAQDRLIDAALGLRALADKSANPQLRYLLDRQLLPLRRTAFELALRQADAARNSSSAVATIWRWLRFSASQSDGGGMANVPSRSATAFDRAVAQDLLATGTAARSKAESAAQRDLLSIFAERTRTDTAVRVVGDVPITALQSSLRPGEVLLAYIDGGPRAALLTVAPDAIALHAAPPRAQLADAARELDALLQDPATPIGQIDASARRLAALVLQPLNGDPIPARLLVLSDDTGTLDRIPWSLLAWPGAAEPLVATTPVALAAIDTAPREAAPESQPRLDVLVAAPRVAADRLDALPDAEIEPMLIAQSVRGRAVTTQDGTDIGIDTFAALLGHENSWVHVSAHGSAEPDRLGYSGIWLNANAAGQNPRFMSWLDILGMRANADLVVLNACQLARRGDIVAANLSFADAVSQAGARQVVASLWAVSDAATMLWDPAFYRAIDADPDHDAAAALRTAQQRLRESRAFTHPFFWAGMQARVRLQLAAPQPRP